MFDLKAERCSHSLKCSLQEPPDPCHLPQMCRLGNATTLCYHALLSPGDTICDWSGSPVAGRTFRRTPGRSDIGVQRPRTIIITDRARVDFSGNKPAVSNPAIVRELDNSVLLRFT
jgi:hypothetical protein